MSALRKEETLMTSEEMLDRNSSWTLACDNALLNRLKKFSEDLTKTSQDILQDCDNLSRSITQLDYRLINVSNEFLMLSNNQFVENRVEEFEEFSPSVSSKSFTATSKTKAEKEAALLSKMKQAIQLGLTTCSERRHRNETTVNRFKTKQPYLIGSPKFFSSKYCGLVDESRRQVPSYQEDPPVDVDSVSIGERYDTYVPPKSQGNSEVKFTMPPTPVFPAEVHNHNDNQKFASGNHSLQSEERITFGRPVIPPSPTVSNRSSDIGAGSVSSVSTTARDNLMPRSVTDELNKIYGSFAPPQTADDDSDDDFRPSAGVGRLFEDDDDDDIFGEKQLFPPSQKKTDFFGRSNTAQLPPTPVFSSVPPPISPVSHSKTAVVNDVQTKTLVGPKPKANDIPDTSSETDDIPRNDIPIREPPSSPETEGPVRTKLPPGAVSMFGSLAPPVFNNGTLQAAPTASKDAPSVISKPDTQISCNSSVEAGSKLPRTLNRDTNVAAAVSSHVHEDVNQKYATSQPSHNVTAPGRTENISQGSLSGCRVVSSKASLSQAVPVSSLFADDSSDEDIFLSSKKQATLHAKSVVQSKENPFGASLTKNTASNSARVTSNNKVEKQPVKKSIFDDSESEDDLFSSSRPSAPRSHVSKIVNPNNDNLFKPDPKKSTVPIKVKKSASLFGDDSDSDTDLFGNKKKVVVKSSSAVASSAKVSPKMEEYKEDTTWDDLLKDSDEQDSKYPVKSRINNNNNNNHIENGEESVLNSTEKQVAPPDHPVVDANPILTKSVIIAQEETIKEKDSAIKKSIFDDSDSDDDLFSSKSTSSVVIAKSESSHIFDQKDPTPPPVAPKLSVGKRSSLFVDDSDSDGDLFQRKSKKNTEKEKSSEGATKHGQDGVDERRLSISKTADIEEDVVADYLLPSQQNSDNVDTAAVLPSKEQQKVVPNFCDENKQEDEPKSSKVLGNKISEKIKAMQSTKAESGTENSESGADLSTKKNIKSKVSVKSLALNLNINPLALKVGARPPKMTGSTPSTPVTDSPSSNVSSVLNSPDRPSAQEILKSNSTSKVNENDEPVTQNIDDDNDDDKQTKLNPMSQRNGVGVDDLVGILKARVKIQKKRRPPSRTFLKKSLAIHDESDYGKDNERDNQSDEKELENKEKVQVENNNVTEIGDD